MPVKAYLFDAQGVDHAVDLAEVTAESIAENQIVWVDVTDAGDADVSQLKSSLEIKDEVMASAMRASDHPQIFTVGDNVQITVLVPQEEGNHFRALPLQLIAGPNYVVALHAGPVPFLDSFDEQTRGDTQLGELDSATFLIALLDRFINSYFEVLDALGAKVDRLDENALRNRRGSRLLNEIVELRHQVTELRRILTPHRQVFATLASPDFDKLAFPGTSPDFSELQGRMEKALEGVETTREMVIGSFDVFTTVVAQNTNDTVRILTVVTVVIGLSGVLAGVMGMNFPDWEFFHTGFTGFATVVAAMVMLSAVLLILAKWRRIF